MDELEPPAQAQAVRLDRLPDRGIAGVVVDHQDLEVRVIELGQAVDRLDHHLRRLVVDREMERDLGQRCFRRRHRRPELAPPAPRP